MIADYLYTMREKLTPSTPEPSEIKQLRALRNERALIIKSRTAFLNLLKNIDEPASIKRMQTIINELNTQVKAIEKSIMEAINSNEKIKQNYNLITTIPGIGLVNAINTIIATCNFTKFQTARQYAKFCCICPLSNESGISVRGGEHISKKGHNEYTINLKKRCCSCLYFQQNKAPFIHAIAVLHFNHQYHQVMSYVDEHYKSFNIFKSIPILNYDSIMSLGKSISSKSKLSVEQEKLIENLEIYDFKKAKLERSKLKLRQILLNRRSKVM